jgi:hypothetical protein
VLIAGLGVFLAGSLVGALAADVGRVVAARAFMGVGGALVTRSWSAQAGGPDVVPVPEDARQ